MNSIIAFAWLEDKENHVETLNVDEDQLLPLFGAVSTALFLSSDGVFCSLTCGS